MKNIDFKVSEHSVKLAVRAMTVNTPVPQDNRTFLDKLLTSIAVSPLYSRKKGFHGLKVKASFKF